MTTPLKLREHISDHLTTQILFSSDFDVIIFK